MPLDATLWIGFALVQKGRFRGGGGCRDAQGGENLKRSTSNSLFISSPPPGEEYVGVRGLSNSYSLSPIKAIKAESELEFCMADCRAGRPTISLEKCNGRVTLTCFQKMGEEIFRLATAEVGGGGRGRGMRK